MGRRDRIPLAIALIAVLGAGCQSVAPAPPVSPAARSAIEACRLPASDQSAPPLLGLDPDTSVEMLVPGGEVIFYTSGNLFAILALIEIGKLLIERGWLSERSLAVALASSIGELVLVSTVYFAVGFGLNFGRD